MITPILKANDAMKFENYRPISVLVCFSKLLERRLIGTLIDINRLSKFIETLIDYQNLLIKIKYYQNINMDLGKSGRQNKVMH